MNHFQDGKVKTKSMKRRLATQKKDRHMTAENEEIASLEQRINQDAPPKGTNPLGLAEGEKRPETAGTEEATSEDQNKIVEYEVYYPAARTFEELPISKKTINGLQQNQYTKLTDIQRAAIPHALCGRDVLGAARTGSGKTLAFVIPILEKLYRNKWTIDDGVGAIIITPTRELALQIFEVLRKVGVAHSLSAGLIIGGKDLKHEQERITRMNILVCTPGRLLQHMDETVGFDCNNTQVLVLDEADRILDMGFSKTLNAIVENIPRQRQTLLFSATQTKSVRDLARLSLKDPEYVSVHEAAQFATPQKLVQHVVIVPLNEKLDTLWGFIKSHLRHKSLIFFSSCKQVRFVYEAFCKLRPGIPLMSIHGKVNQTKRMGIFFDFCKRKEAVLFATDIAARGLDFPKVDWVVQVDCPEDVPTYIHRVGRTARYDAGGCSLLFLTPSEKAMIPLLEQHKVPVKVIKVNPKEKRTPLQSQLESMLTQEPELKYLAQKSFISYMRSVWLQSNKEIFDVHALPAAEYAKSLGLASTPRIKFIKTTKKDKNFVKNHLEEKLDLAEKEELESEEEKPVVVTKVQKLMKRKNNTLLSEAYDRIRDKGEESSEEDDDVLVVRRKNHDIEFDDDEQQQIEKEIQKEKQSSKPRKPVAQKEVKPAPKQTKFESSDDDDDEEMEDSRNNNHNFSAEDDDDDDIDMNDYQIAFYGGSDDDSEEDESDEEEEEQKPQKKQRVIKK